MAYRKYRVKIGENIVSDMLVAKGTYSFQKQDRVIESYDDEEGITHEIVAKKKKVVISFSFKEHELDEHQSIADFIKEKNNVNIQYWDDEECEYKDGLFKISGGTFSHRTTHGENIKYNACPVTLEEY